MEKNSSIVKLLLRTTAFGLFIFILCLILPTKADAALVGCSQPDRYYNCLLSWGDLDKEINAWCQFTKGGTAADGSTFRNQCLFTLAGSTERGQAELKRIWGEGKDVNIAGCYTGALTPAEKKEVCTGVIIAKSGTVGKEWHDAIAQAVAECGLPDSPSYDLQCATNIKKEFLSSKGWADKPEEPKPIDSDISVGTKGQAAADTPFMKRVAAYLKWMFAGIGLLAVFGFIISAIQYSAAQDNPKSIADAKERMVNIIYGVLIFGMMFGLLQWLIPGGIF